MNIKVVVLCVNYNSTQCLVKYLDSLEKALRNTSNVELVVIIGDNSFPEENINKQYNFIIKQYFSGKNLGYFGGIEYAINKSEIRLNQYDYIVISNVDVQVDLNFFRVLKSKSFSTDIGCIAPSICSNLENIDRNPKILNRNSKRKMWVLSLLYKFPLLYYIYYFFIYPIRRKSIQQKRIEQIYAAHGSFMIFTNQAANFLQTMEFPTFLFGEEIFIAEEMKNIGLKTLYMPELVVNDSEHVSTKKLKKRTYFKYNYNAMKMLLRRYYNEQI